MERLSETPAPTPAPAESKAPPADTRSCDFAFNSDILVVRNVIDWGDKLIDSVERLNIWERATMTSAGGNKQYHGEARNNDAVTVAGHVHVDFTPFEIALCQAFNQCAHAYRALNKHFFATTDTYHQVLRYASGQHFHEHSDNIAGHQTWGARQLSGVAFLNDGFEGGSLDFPRQQMTVKPVKGTIVLFPSFYTHPHASLDVTKGVKYSAVTWWV